VATAISVSDNGKSAVSGLSVCVCVCVCVCICACVSITQGAEPEQVAEELAGVTQPVAKAAGDFADDVKSGAGKLQVGCFRPLKPLDNCRYSGVGTPVCLTRGGYDDGFTFHLLVHGGGALHCGLRSIMLDPLWRPRCVKRELCTLTSAGEELGG
jgi:hypothetical protein